MKIIALPLTTNPMQYGVGLQGVTLLNQSQFKRRYSGLKDYEEIPGGIIQRKSKQKKKVVSRAVKRYQEFKRSKMKSRIKKYVVNKSVIKSRIAAYVNQMSGEKMLYFWTVTFPVKTQDQVALLLLNKWLTRLRQENLLKSYLWVNERQENKTLHYHIAIPKKIDVKKANRYMRAAIMTCINQNLIIWDRTDAAKYNGVHISKDRKTGRVINFAKKKKQKSLQNYLTKYVTKNNEAYNQLAWHNSRDFSNLIIRVNITYGEWIRSRFPQMIDELTALRKEHFTFYRWKGSPPDELLKHIKFVQNHIDKLIT